MRRMANTHQLPNQPTNRPQTRFMPTQGFEPATLRATVWIAELSKPIAHNGGGKAQGTRQNKLGAYIEEGPSWSCVWHFVDKNCLIIDDIANLPRLYARYPGEDLQKMRYLFIAIVAAATTCAHASPMPPPPMPGMPSPAPKMPSPPSMNSGMGMRPPPPPPPPKDAEDAAVRVSSVGSCAVSLHLQ